MFLRNIWTGIKILEESKIVLMGGFNKKLNLKPLAKRAGSKDIRFVGLFGPAGGEIARFLKSFGIKKYIFKTRMWDAFIAVIHQKGEIFFCLRPVRPVLMNFMTIKKEEENLKN